MKQLLFSLLIICSICTHAQTISIHTFGKPANPALIFMHGGPGSNAISFEATTANRLANLGYYVISYDRRGEGRSEDSTAAYTFQQTFDDLNNIYRQYHLQQATLIGFSFGGIIASLYTYQYPEKVHSLVLVSSLINLQATYNTIIVTCRNRYFANHDTAGVRQIRQLLQLNRYSIEFRSGCFQHATRNGLFSTPPHNKLAAKLYAQLNKDSLYQYYNNKKSSVASNGFWKKEQYTRINLTDKLKKLAADGKPVYAIYGKEDGLYSQDQVDVLLPVTGKEHLLYLPQAAHYLFIDQQDAFIAALKSWQP